MHCRPATSSAQTQVHVPYVFIFTTQTKSYSQFDQLKNKQLSCRVSNKTLLTIFRHFFLRENNSLVTGQSAGLLI